MVATRASSTPRVRTKVIPKKEKGSAKWKKPAATEIEEKTKSNKKVLELEGVSKNVGDKKRKRVEIVDATYEPEPQSDDERQAQPQNKERVAGGGQNVVVITNEQEHEQWIDSLITKVMEDVAVISSEQAQDQEVVKPVAEEDVAVISNEQEHEQWINNLIAEGTSRFCNETISKKDKSNSRLKKSAIETTPTSKKSKKVLEIKDVSRSSKNVAEKKWKRVEVVNVTSNEPAPELEPRTESNDEHTPSPAPADLLHVMGDSASIEQESEPQNLWLLTRGVAVMRNEQENNQGISNIIVEAMEDMAANAISNEQEEDQQNIDPLVEDSNKEKKTVDFNDKGQPIGEGAAPFISELGSLMRKHCPISYEKWCDVPDQIKKKLWTLVTDKYIVPVAYRGKIIDRIHNYWRSYKSALRAKHYDSYDTDEERKMNCPKGVEQDAWEIFVHNQSLPAAKARRKAGKIARQHMKTPHVSGRKGAARTAEALKNGDPFATVTRTDLYLAMHSRKDGSCPTPELQRKVEQIKAITKENPNSVNLDVDHDPVAQVYGRETRGFVRGMGIGVSRASLFNSAPAIDQLQTEKRLRLSTEDQIAELKEQLISQKEEIDKLRQDVSQIAELKKQITCQGLMLADMRELLTRLCS